MELEFNHIGGVYGAMDDVFQFIATFREFPPRSFPPSFVPSTIMEDTMNELKDQMKQNKAGSRALQ